MCKELEERKTEQNIDLGFTDFCNKTCQQNWGRFIKIGYIVTQYDALSRGGLLPDMDALTIATQFAMDYHTAGFMDMLGRQDDFVFKD